MDALVLVQVSILAGFARGGVGGVIPTGNDVQGYYEKRAEREADDTVD